MKGRNGMMPRDYMRNFYKLFLVVLNFIFFRKPFLCVFGQINKHLKLVNTLFVAYPASEQYTKAYALEKMLPKMRWNPWPVGFFVQNGKLGIMTVISNLESEFFNESNYNNLQRLLDRTSELCGLLQIPRKSFAGVLPGVFFLKRIVSYSIEAEVTVDAIIKAETKIRELESYNMVPLIILGGRGFIGRRLVRAFNGREIYSIDLKMKNVSEAFKVVNGKKAILINVAAKGALNEYIKYAWKELILLNEVYPAPSQEELSKWKRRGGNAYHIVGVKAFSFPSFPVAYKGGIPCCAAWHCKEMEALVCKL